MSHEKTNSNLCIRLFPFIGIILIKKAPFQVSLAKIWIYLYSIYILHIITRYRLVFQLYECFTIIIIMLLRSFANTTRIFLEQYQIFSTNHILI